MRKNHSISIIKLLRISCVVLMLLMIVVYAIVGDGIYTNLNTISLGELLGILLLFMLYDANVNNNKLLILLSWWLISFFLLRIITLNYTEYSAVLPRCNADVRNVNNTILLLMAGGVVLWAAIHISKSRSRNNYNTSSLSGISLSFNWTTILFFISYFIYFIGKLESPLSGVLSIITNFLLYPTAIVFLYTTYITTVWPQLNKIQRVIALSAMGLFLIEATLTGSRGGIFNLLIILFIAFLAQDYKKIKKRYVLGVVILVPLMFAVFVFTTYMRKLGAWQASTQEKVELIPQVIEIGKDLDTKDLVAPMFDRVGFLDFMIEMNANRAYFSSFINLKEEFKATVDNALSPGFDLFDAPKIGTRIANSYSYGLNTVLSKKLNTKEDHKSDALTMFGESYVIFGIPLCFLFVAVIGTLFKKYWLYAHDSIFEKAVIKKAMCLFFFYSILYSYGFDWFILDVLRYYIAYCLFVSQTS